jgi:hypothetical protein
VSRAAGVFGTRAREWCAVLGIALLALILAALVVLTPWHPAALLHRAGAQPGPERIVAVTTPAHRSPAPTGDLR